MKTLVFSCLVGIAFLKFVKTHESQISKNELACPYGRLCITIDSCPAVESMMIRKTLPAQRFRLAVCGYEGTMPKVCCSTSRDFDQPEARFGRIYARPETKAECGKSFLPISSDPFTLGSFPFLARIGFVSLITGETKYPCVGSIIDARTVLTTATCALAQSDKYKLQSVLVGEYDTSTNPDCNQLFCGHKPSCHKISYVVKHPGFHGETFADNIALVRLQESINFTITTQPICVHTGREFDLLAIDGVRLFGWGKISSETNPANEIRVLRTRLLPQDNCAEFVNQGLSVELCAIAEEEPCAGFSGSPIVRITGNTYTVIGILSYGSSCEGSRNSPVAFVDVQRYADWIKQN